MSLVVFLIVLMCLQHFAACQDTSTVTELILIICIDLQQCAEMKKKHSSNIHQKMYLFKHTNHTELY